MISFLTLQITHHRGLHPQSSAEETAADLSELCPQTDDDEQGGLRFEIGKRRIGIRLTALYSAERWKTYSNYAKNNGIKGSAEQ